MKITEFFINHQKFSNILLIFIVLVGVLTLKSLPRQDRPDIDFDHLNIRTLYPGASPQDVEINVTDPLEDELDEVDGLEDVLSFSIENMSYIMVRINPDLKATEKERIKRDVRNAVDRVTDFPPEVDERPFVEERRSSSYPIIELSLSGQDVSEQRLRKVAKDLESELKEIVGVGSIDKVGYRKRELQVLADIDRMEEEYVSFSEILNAIKERNVKFSGGTIESTVNEKKIVTFSEFEEPLDVADCIIRGNFSGKQLKVSDVALLSDDFERRSILVRTNGRNSINLIIKRKSNSDVISLSEEVKKIITMYQKRLKLEGITLHIVVDYTRYTSVLLDIVSNNAIIGLVLVLLSLFFFLNFQTAFWVAMGFPFAIFGAFIFFPLFGMTMNQIVLIAMIIVLGMVVDDAIVVAENINRYQQKGFSSKDAAIKGTKEVFLPIFVTSLTTIICFTPMYFMTGIMGKFVYSIPTVVILMLILSLFESVTILPGHLAHLKESSVKKPKIWIERLCHFYGKKLNFFLHHRKSVLFGSMCVIALTIALMLISNRFVLFLSIDSDIFYIVMETQAGDSLEANLKKVKEVEAKVERISRDLLLGYTTNLGHHRTDESISTPANHEHWGLITVYLKPASERSVRSETVIEQLSKDVKSIPGFMLLNVRARKKGPPVGRAITLTLISDDFDLAQFYEQKVLKTLQETKGVYSIESNNRMGKEEVRLILNYDLMAKLGITAKDIADTIRIAYDGIVATSIRRDGEEIDFRIKLRNDQRGDVEILDKLLLRNDEGKLIPLGELATFTQRQGIESFNHYNGRRAITITGKVDNLQATSKEVNQMIKDLYVDEIQGISGIKLLFRGEGQATAESMHNFFIAFLCGLLGIYFILLLLLNSYIQPFLIMVAIPFGIVGVLFAFYLHDLPMSFFGLIGTLGMLGVVVNDSLVMVTYLNKLRDKYGRIDTEMILEGAKTRFRPVLLTTITTVIGLFPTLYGIGGYDPFIVPLVLAMSWGLAFATFITLVLVPVLYSFLKPPVS
jgi:multidrug efflux pump subunit AcrB